MDRRLRSQSRGLRLRPPRDSPQSLPHPAAVSIGWRLCGSSNDNHGDRQTRRNSGNSGTGSSLIIKRLGNRTMSSSARTRPGVRLGHQSRSHRIQFRVTQRFPQMRPLKRTGEVPSLPSVSNRAVDHVPIAVPRSPGSKVYPRTDNGLMRVGTCAPGFC